MNWDAEKVMGPRCVVTPDVEGDIARLFLDDICVREARKMIASRGQAQLAKLRVLAERLEFVDHLSTIAAEFRKRTTSTSSTRDLGDGRRSVTETYHLELWGHDFAGADFDIEALVVYLLMTCVDTIKGQPEHVDPFQWLRERASKLAGGSPQEVQSALATLSVEFSEEHGLSRRFVAAFVEDLSEEIKERLIRSLAAVKIGEGEILAASASAWEQKDLDEKAKKLASTLYGVRSTFTHAATRSFCPSQPVALLGKTDTVVVQLPGGEEFLKLMRVVVVFLTRKLILEHPKP